MIRVASSVGAVVVVSIASFGCVDLGWIDLRFQPLVDRSDTGQSKLEPINSPEQWVQFFSDQISARMSQTSLDSCAGDGFLEPGIVFDTMEDADAAPPPRSAPPAQEAPEAVGAPGDGEGADDAGSAGPAENDFTSTNIQEIGVDESDVFKSDGEYFYIMVGNTLRIVRGWPVEALAEVAELEIDANSYATASLFMNADRLVVVSETQPVLYVDEEILPGPAEPKPAVDWDFYPSGSTVVTLIDVTDPDTPSVEAKWLFDGAYANSRMIGGVLHVVLSQYPSIPHDIDLDGLTVQDIDQYVPSYSATFADGSEKAGMLVSPERFYRPVDADGYGITTVLSLDTNGLADGFSSVAIMADPGTIYASQQAMYLTDPDYDWYCGYRETLDVHKFDLTTGGASYSASGSVEGRLLNQFSMGEHKDHLRVATTTGNVWDEGENLSKNHVFVLEENTGLLNVVGELRDIAPGERIYSARFMGARGFLVTFRQVDPLFTLDLSDPAAPQVVGELKVTGYSDYIHFLDEDHLLTLGKAATEDGFVQGLQISVFDVSEFAAPRLLVSKEIGTRGTESEALYNHKAFTFYEAESLLAIPVDLYEAAAEDDWGDYVFSGLQVYEVSPEVGIDLRGQIATAPADAGWPVYYGWTRGAFIEDTVYAITEIGVKAAPIATPSALLSEIPLAGSPHFYDFTDEGDDMRDDPVFVEPDRSPVFRDR